MSEYENLTKLWKEQNEVLEKWRHSLLRQAYELREAVIKEIGAPEWAVTSFGAKSNRRYVEVVDLSQDDTPQLLSLENSVTDRGEIIFGLSVVLENAPNTFPKSAFHQTMAVRYNKQQAEYVLWSRSGDRPEQGENWSNDKSAMARKFVESLTKHFSFDPFEAPIKKSSIGFIAG